MNRLFALTILLLSFASTIAAQDYESESMGSTNECTTIGIGSYNLRDTYLSPSTNMNYVGWSARVMNDRLKRTRLMDGQISRQQVISVEYGSTSNGAETANEYAGFVTYNLGYLYRFKNTPIDGLNLLAGSSVRAAAGCIYNTRNGNNPVSGKADIDLNLSGMAIYNFHIGNYPLTLRYQMEVPFAGILFSVHKGQPYYFVSQEGYTDGLTKITSLGNKFMMKNYFSLDFPVGAFTVRVGYLNNIYRTDINDIKTHVLSNQFVIGFVREFISFGGKQMKQARKYNSAYY